MTIPRNLSFLAEGASSTGVLRTANGGTALTSFTANGILYASSSSVLATGSGLQFDGTNLAIGITPASWYATNSRAFQVGSSTSIFDYSASGNRQTGLLNNAYLNASGVYTYLNTDPASRYHQTGGQHYWYTAPSSSGAITWTQSLFISNAGGVSIGNTTDPGATNLSVTGTAKSSSFIINPASGGYFLLNYNSSISSRSWKFLNDFNAYGDFGIQQSTTQTGSTYSTIMYIAPTGGVSIGNLTDAGAGNLNINGTVKTGGYTVAGLPAGVTGARTYVTDALAPSYGATVVGGGAVTIPVFYNGTNWIVA